MKKLFQYLFVMGLIAGLLFFGSFGKGLTIDRIEASEEPYEKLQILSQVLSMIQKEYVEQADTDKLIYGAINGMLDTLDPHSSFLPPEIFREMQTEMKGSFGGLGIEITRKDDVLTIVSPIEDTPAFEAGLQAGDMIVAIEKEPTKNMTLMDAVKKMRGKPGTKVSISIVREGWQEPKDFTITRAIIKVKSVKAKEMEDGIAYMRITAFQERTSHDLEDAIAKIEKEKPIRGMVLDLRDNPGGPLDQAVMVSDLFVSNGLIVSMEGRNHTKKTDYPATEKGTREDFPMVVLINEGSASASEIVAGALQDQKRAVIVGTKSFGKGSVQTLYPLAGNTMGLKLTTARYFTPNGRSIQAEGIKPDITVENIVQEPKGKKIRHLREVDLERHFKKDGEEEKEEENGETEEPQGKIDKEEEKESGEEGKAPVEEEKKEGEEEAKETKKEEKEDIQLQRAIEILKSYEIFQKKV